MVGVWATKYPLYLWRGCRLEVSHMVSQPRRPNKSSGHQASMSFPGWQSSLYTVTLGCWESNTVQDSPGRTRLEALRVVVSWTLLYAFLPLADFSLYPYPIISHKGEYNSLNELSESFNESSNARVVWPSELTTGVIIEGGLADCTPLPNFAMIFKERRKLHTCIHSV